MRSVRQVKGVGHMVIQTLILVILATSACTVSRPSSPAAVAAEPEPPRIQRAQLMVGGVTLGQNEAALQRALGSPLRTDDVVDGITDKPAKELYFDGVEVYLHEDEAYNVKCTSPRYATTDGARVGQRVADIVRTYGPGETYPSDGESLIRYNVAGTDTYLIFHIRDGAVVMVELWFDYT